MVSPYVCPECGADDVAGTRDDDAITLTCGVCGHRWERGERRCHTCGGGNLALRPRHLMSNPRGNQTAWIARGDVALCPVCDAAALRASLTENAPVPHDYASRALGASDPPPSAPRRLDRIAVVALSPAPHRSPQPTSTPAPVPAPTAPRTLRQTCHDAGDNVDAFALIVLGREFGPSSRVDAALCDRIDAWLAAGPPALDTQAIAALGDLVSSWRRS